MKKILIRTGMSPLVDTPVPEILANNRLGNNVGNLVYAYSIYRGLMTDREVELIPTEYLIGRLDVDKINEEYDSFVIPLADFIRPDRVGEIKAMTKLIDKLKIPCTIVGIGIRAEYDYESKGILFQEDKVAYDFIKAVLNKSSIIGVRGEITGDYLKKLGFRPEVDYTVIGCPSFYTFGENLSFRKPVFSREAKLAFNNTCMTEENVQEFLERTRNEFPNSLYFPQTLGELKLLYLGSRYIYYRERLIEGYPDTLSFPVYQKDMTRFHTNFISWLNELKQCDFSIGPRLHGNVMAVLAGIPAIWIMHDARMRELVSYHNLPHIRNTEINEKTDVLELFARIDYKSVLKGHKERFHHYLDFLEKNGIQHIFHNRENPAMAPLDEKIKELNIPEKEYSVKSVLRCSVEEIIDRRNQFEAFERENRLYQDEKNNEVKEKLKQVNASLKSAKEDIKKMENALKKEQKRRKELEDSLDKKNEELEEAQKSFTFLVRRKIQKIVGKQK